MSRFVDSLITYRILKTLVTPFQETDAFRLGIIDDKGRELKKMSQFNTVAERDAYTILDRLVFRLKKIIEKVPLENKRLVSFAAALSLVKENIDLNIEPIDFESQYLNRINTNLQKELAVVNRFLKEDFTLTFKQFLEEVPANNAGSPGVDGFTPETIGVNPKRKKFKIFKQGEVKNVESS